MMKGMEREVRTKCWNLKETRFNKKRVLETRNIVITTMNVSNRKLIGITIVMEKIIRRGIHSGTWMSGMTVVVTTMITTHTPQCGSNKR